MEIAIALFEGFTALDAIGPYTVFANHPGWSVTFVAAERGPLHDDRSLTVDVQRTLADAARPDVIVVPGGVVTRRMARDGHPVIDWIREAHPHARWTTSVCTGSILLAAAGVLDGVDATSHWYALDQLAPLGANPVAERVVIGDGVATAAGVSSGIDLALALVGHISGDFVAQAVQLGIEYDPQPPFDTGSVAKAPADLCRIVGDGLRRAEDATLAAPA